MKVRYTATALREIGDILAYIANDNPAAAAAVEAALRSTIKLISERHASRPWSIGTTFAQS